MNSELDPHVVDAVVAERLRDAERIRRSRVEWRETPDPYEIVTVRLARAADAEAVARLAQRDGHRMPVGPTVIAEVGGAVLAARSLETGASAADPFRPTAQLAELLELRAAHLESAARPKGPRSVRRILARLRLRRRRGALS